MDSTLAARRLAAPGVEPTLWGLTPTTLHERFWASQGIGIVRPGQVMPLAQRRMYLMLDSRSLVIFRMPLQVGLSLRMSSSKVFIARLQHSRKPRILQRVTTHADRSFARIDDIHDHSDRNLTRIAITTDRKVAAAWQAAPDEAWRRLRRLVPREYRSTTTIQSHVFDRDEPAEAESFVRELLSSWHKPNATITGIERFGSTVWKQIDTDVAMSSRIIGSVWIGHGREVPADTTIAGPAVLWDDHDGPPALKRLPGKRVLRPTEWVDRSIHIRHRSLLERTIKRTFDIVFSLIAITLTLPIYPVVMLAIWLEDGLPILFGHRRETYRGKEFMCWKFRSMRKDAEKIKARLRQENMSNGPHFYMHCDPRLTKIGRIIRKTNIDELPQFFNVLAGSMSIVGPRPSPHSENQWCPSWREARLSVRPGITGLWQVKRTRKAGEDFQEWLKYDVQYVESGGFWMDIKIIVLTVLQIFIHKK